MRIVVQVTRTAARRIRCAARCCTCRVRSCQQTMLGRVDYVVLQVVLKEKFLGVGSGNLTELESVINVQAAKGYRLHTITTAASGSKGFGGGDRIQATMVFERLGLGAPSA